MMKRTKQNKVLALLLAAAMVLAMMPSMAFADVDQEYGITISTKEGNNTNISANNAADVLDDGGSVTYDASTNTLTLNNADLEYDKEGTSVIYVPNDKGLTLNLIGNNKISAYQCIFVTGALTITGSGSLNAVGSVYAVCATGDLVIDGVSVTASSTKSCGAIQAHQGAVTIQNHASVKAESSGAWGIYGDKGVFIKDSEVEAVSTSSSYFAGINSAGGGNITIENSTVTAKSQNDAGISSGADLTITNSTVSAETAFDHENYGIFAIGAEGNVTISGGEVDATATGKFSNAIYSGKTIKITDDAKVTAAATNAEAYPALYGKEGVSVSSSTVNAESGGDAGVFSPLAVTIENGSDVTAKGYWPAVRGNTGVTISASKVDAESTNDVAIFSQADVEIKNSVVNAAAPEGTQGVKSNTTASAAGSWISTSGDETFEDNIANSVLINGNTGSVIGKATIPGDVTVPEGTTVTVPAGAELIVPEGVILNNEGTINVEGAFTDNGQVNCTNHKGNSTSYSAEGSTIRYICAVCGSELGSVTITAPANLTFDGSAKNAVITTTGDWNGEVPTAEYYSGAEKLSGAPTNAGTYTARITMASATASVEFTITKKASSGSYPTTPTVQKPTIDASEGAAVTLNSTGTTATITVADGYELVDVTVNGVSKGAVTTLTGLKTGDKVVVTARKIETPDDSEALIDAVKNTKLVARSMLAAAPSGKKSIKVYWFNKNGSELDFDGYEVYRSLKKNSGYGTKPIFKTTKERYFNTAIKRGTRYYYKVRAYKVINGEKIYTPYSLKAWRTAK